MPVIAKLLTPRLPHPRVGDSPQRLTLGSSVLSPGAAREFTRHSLAAWGLPISYEVVLTVNELVTNAVVHTNGSVILTLDRRGDFVRVVVADESLVLPSDRSDDLEATGGRGLSLVAAISKQWGVSEGESGKTVWAEVAVDVEDARP